MNYLSCFIIDDESSIAVLTESITRGFVLKLIGSSTPNASVLNTLVSIKTLDVLFLSVEFLNEYDINLLSYGFLQKTLVIVTSLNTENAYKAFEHGFFDYLVKPFAQERLLQVLSRVTEVNRPVVAKDWFYIHSGNKGKIVKLMYHDIKYIQGNQNFVTIVSDSDSYIVYQTMKAIGQKLPQYFMRVHKSFIVNETKVKSINNDCIHLFDKTIVKIGPLYKEDLLRNLIHDR